MGDSFQGDPSRESGEIRLERAFDRTPEAETRGIAVLRAGLRLIPFSAIRAGWIGEQRAARADARPWRGTASSTCGKSGNAAFSRSQTAISREIASRPGTGYAREPTRRSSKALLAASWRVGFSRARKWRVSRCRF